jgi:CheY-like chemotaxis protein
MPEMDGYETTKNIRRGQFVPKHSRNIPIIALTANAVKGDDQRCFDVGMNAYLAKPITISQLRNKIFTLFTGETNKIQKSEYSNNLKESIGDKDFLNLVHSYLKTSLDNLEKMKEGIKKTQPQLISKASHSLKSTTALLGEKDLAQLIQEIETLSSIYHINIHHFYESYTKAQIHQILHL